MAVIDSIVHVTVTLSTGSNCSKEKFICLHEKTRPIQYVQPMWTAKWSFFNISVIIDIKYTVEWSVQRELSSRSNGKWRDVSVVHTAGCHKRRLLVQEGMVQDSQVAESAGSQQVESVQDSHRAGGSPRGQACSPLDSQRPQCSVDSPFQVQLVDNFPGHWLVDIQERPQHPVGSLLVE